MQEKLASPTPTKARVARKIYQLLGSPGINDDERTTKVQDIRLTRIIIFLLKRSPKHSVNITRNLIRNNLNSPQLEIKAYRKPGKQFEVMLHPFYRYQKRLELQIGLHRLYIDPCS